MQFVLYITVRKWNVMESFRVWIARGPLLSSKILHWSKAKPLGIRSVAPSTAGQWKCASVIGEFLKAETSSPLCDSAGASDRSRPNRRRIESLQKACSDLVWKGCKRQMAAVCCLSPKKANFFPFQSPRGGKCKRCEVNTQTP